MTGPSGGGEGVPEPAWGLAPVTPLFGDAARGAARTAARPAHDLAVASAPGAHASRAPVPAANALDDRSDASLDVVGARDALLRRLRGRSLSVREARTMLRDAHCADDVADGVIAEFAAQRWLDDTALAEQLVHAGTTRKGQGRRAIARTLQARGVDREVADAVLADLPDDDEERAAAYARGKARSLLRHDDDTALRRLVGQLARRGFPGSVAMAAARVALDEARRDGGVRFR